MSIQVQHRRDTNTNIEAVTPAVAELGMDITKSEALIGDGVTAGGIRLAKKNVGEILIATQISANTNDYNPSGLKHARKLIISTDAARDITGIVPSSPAGTTDGRELTVYNGGANNATLRDQSASSSAANRFDLGGADITLQPKASVTLRYRTQGALNRWEVDASTAGAAVASGAVIARTLAGSALGMAAGMVNGKIVESHAGSAVTFAVKTLAGNDASTGDPVLAVFQDGAGGYVMRSITAALSLTISNGSSMGVPGNNVAFRLWLALIDTGAGVVLGAVNCLSGKNILPLQEGITYSSTAEGGAGAADNAQTIYTTAAQASKYLCLAAYADYDSGLATAGAWAASPTRIVLWSPGSPRPGAVIQDVMAVAGTSTTGTTVIPQDNTIPQNTEGDQYMSQAITTQAIQNVLVVEAEVAEISNSALGNLIIALFQDTTANAFAVAIQAAQGVATQVGSIGVAGRILAGVLGSTTIKLRAGSSSAGTTTFNGQSGGQQFGGALSSFIRVIELMG